jgi:hypothetical protein
VTDGSIDPNTGETLQYTYNMLWSSNFDYGVDDTVFYYSSSTGRGHLRLMFRVPQAGSYSNSNFDTFKNPYGMLRI